MIRVDDYLRLGFALGGRERPAVDCWGLYRLIVGESTGIWLEAYAGVEAHRDIARQVRRDTAGPGWLQVAPGTEREMDMVVMTGLVGRGRATVAAPLHVGCVIDEGGMIDIEETTGVMVRPFRGTVRRAALPTVVNRVVGIVRPVALA